jgi:hypothetical protein
LDVLREIADYLNIVSVARVGKFFKVALGIYLHGKGSIRLDLLDKHDGRASRIVLWCGNGNWRVA